MRTSEFNRYALRLFLSVRFGCAAVALTALLCACAAPSSSEVPGIIRSSANYARNDRAKDEKAVFKYTGAEQRFTVPAGVTKLTVTADGASGSRGYGDGASGGGYASSGGVGGRVTATILVTPGQILEIYVGGSGERRGFNGGGTGQRRDGRGGGASDVRQDGNGLAQRVVVAAGGGGGGAVGECVSTSCGYGMGGNGGGGGRHGGSGGRGHGYLGAAGGTGGSQRAAGKGGAGASSGCPGANGSGGAGGDGQKACGGYGGGGGGGYYGGGGGGGGGQYGSSGSGYSGSGGGGGGGSSFAEKSATGVQMSASGHRGNGEVVIVW